MKKLLALLMVAVIGIGLYPTLRHATAGEEGSISLKDLPDFYRGGREYKVDPYIAAAAKLQAAGKVKAQELLLELAKDKEHGQKVIVLCRMLFTAKASGEFRRPAIGGAIFLGATNYADWPLEPIELLEGVPFLVVKGYILGGRAERAESYAKYCISDCVWRAEEFKSRTAAQKQKALERLFASPKWKAGPSDDEKQFLTSQIN